jgi:hypothetical protein
MVEMVKQRTHKSVKNLKAESKTHRDIKLAVAEVLKRFGYKTQVEKHFEGGRMDICATNDKGEQIEIEIWKTHRPDRFIVKLPAYNFDTEPLISIGDIILKREYEPPQKENDDVIIETFCRGMLIARENLTKNTVTCLTCLRRYKKDVEVNKSTFHCHFNPKDHWYTCFAQGPINIIWQMAPFRDDNHQMMKILDTLRDANPERLRV